MRKKTLQANRVKSATKPPQAQYLLIKLVMKMANSRQRTTMLLMNAKRIANGKLNLGRVFPVQARLLLPEKMSNDPIFRVVENSYFNRSLRSAAQKLGHGKYIHCLLARHTFATTCITLGTRSPLQASCSATGIWKQR